MRLLLLGGTGEARALAAALQDWDIDVVSSLAGRVTNPALPVGTTRIGGFGGVAGLAEYLRHDGIDAVVDATHPFAASITSNAAAATAQTGTPLLVLRRPGWTAGPDDQWNWVSDIGAAAAATSAAPPGTVFLTTGRRDLAAFAADASHRYLVRAVDPPGAPMPVQVTVLLDRGPYTVEGEQALMHEHGVSLLVTKDSGGTMTAAKLTAARALGLPVVVVERPALPPGVRAVQSVETVLAWLGPDGGWAQSG